MNKNNEANIAFKMWEHMAKLESILWDRYYEDFLDLILEQEDAKISQDDTQDVKYPF